MILLFRIFGGRDIDVRFTSLHNSILPTKLSRNACFCSFGIFEKPTDTTDSPERAWLCAHQVAMVTAVGNPLATKTAGRAEMFIRCEGGLL